jgi:polygalacturonase
MKTLEDIVLFKDEFCVGKTMIFDLSEDAAVDLEFTPDASGRCELIIPSGEIVNIPGPGKQMTVRRVLEKGEVRIISRSGDGILTVKKATDSHTKCIPKTEAQQSISITSSDNNDVFGGKNVKNFGAVGNGVVNDTSAIQKALDAGGAVYIPGGRYKIGTLYLRDNGGITLAPDAVLIASENINDYNKPDFCPQNLVSVAEKTNGAHLIVAIDCKNVYLNGFGAIDGNRSAFFDPYQYPSRDHFPGLRPAQMIYICESENVRIENLNLINSPYWSCFIHGCRDVAINGLRINNFPRESWNGDGIDIDCSKNVTVSNCIIRSSDDSLTIRASRAEKLQKNNDGICENIIVTNCVLSKGHCGIRLGVGGGVIRNCAISNCVTKDCWMGIGVHSTYLPKDLNSPGVDIENIVFDNIAIDGGAPFYLANSSIMGAQEGQFPHSKHTIKNISFNNIQAHSYWNALIEGSGNQNIYNISFNNVAFEMYGGDEIRTDVPLSERFNYLSFRYPYAMYIANLRDCIFNNFRVSWHEKASNLWQKSIEMNNCKDLAFINCKLPER